MCSSDLHITCFPVTIALCKEKVGLFDRNGRKDKKKRLNDIYKTGYMLENKLFNKAEKAERKATKNFRFS